MKTLTAILLAGVLASGCATTGSGIERTQGEQLFDKYEPYLGEPVKSFTALQKDSWQPISRTQLVLWTTINDAYLLTVTGNCSQLPFAQAVGVTSTTSQISTLDSVLVRGDRCPITQIQPIDVRRMKADRAAAQAS
jgi:Family of unknown function (DUF6491)